MLHRSFKPSKCKTSLKLAASRLKLFKNKKEVLLKQLKRELAQLLESGQEQTARIRVEHVVREEKTIAAYDLLEIYCEIIAARLPIIESQKNCPIDLKEAITSVIFASPRCADITEFVDIRKHFTAKYGKEFATAAVELRPESGVSRMLVEKLSVKAPDGEAKIKILSAIAEEHNIKWDPASFGVQESKPSDDLLNGPNTFENASRMHTEPPAVQTHPSNIQAPPNPDPKDKNTPVPSKKNAGSSSNLQKKSSGDASSGPMTTEAASYPGTRPSGSGSERMDATHLHSRDGNAYSAGSQNWNMEFKDATAAAEAAAEAAERASMAARAAAELSGHGQIKTEYSTESPRFKRHDPRDDRPSESIGSKLSGKEFSKDSRQDTVHDKDPKIQSDLVDRNEHVKQEGLSERFHQDGHNSIKRSSLASLRPTSASNQDDKMMNELQGTDLHLQKKQQKVEVTEVKKSRVFSEVNSSNKYSKSDLDFQSEDNQDNLHYEDFNHFGEERMEEKASGVTSQSHSSNRDNVHGISHSSHRTSSINTSENLFPSIDHDTTHGETVVSSSYSDAAVVFDDPLSDDDDFLPDTRSGFDAVEDPSPSSNRNAIHRDAAAKKSSSSNATVAFEDSDSDDDAIGLSSRSGYDESLTETKESLKEKDELTVNFDDFGGPSSESEDDLVKSGFGNLNHNRSRTHGLTSKRKQKLQMSPADKEQVDVIGGSDEGVEFGFQSSMKFDSDYVPSGQLPSRHSKTSLASNSTATDNSNSTELPGTMNDDRYFNQSSTESNSELKFGNLRGGLRNKRSPYTINPPVAAATASKRLPEDSAAAPKQATPSSAIGAGNSTNIEVIAAVEQKPSPKTTTRLTDVDRVDTDDPSEQTPVSSGRTGGVFSRRTKANSGLVVQSSLNARPKTEFKHNFSSPTSVTGSDSDVSDEELPEKHFNRKRQSSVPKSSQQSNAELRSEGPFKYFDTDDSDSDALAHTSTISGRAGIVPSRRTKVSPDSGTKSYVKARVSGEAINSDADLVQRPSSSFSGSESPSKPETQKVKPARRGSSVEESTEQATSKPIPGNIPKHDLKLKPSAVEQTSSPLEASTDSGTKSYMKARVSGEAINSYADLVQKPSSSSYGSESPSKPETQKVKPARRSSSVEESTEQATSKPIAGNIPKHDLKLKPSAMEQTSSPLNSAASGSSGSPKPSTSSGNDPSREDNVKKASHVHPKLPDYDSLAARFQSLRENRQ